MCETTMPAARVDQRCDDDGAHHHHHHHHHHHGRHPRYHFREEMEGGSLTESATPRIPDSECDPYLASPSSKYARYEVRVDSLQNDRAAEIKILSWKRPHSRALHCAWMSFFLAFTIWFSVAPLLVEIRRTLGLSKAQIWTSSICSDLSTIFLRLLIGPMCDRYGSRIPMGVVLMVASIPTAMVGLVNSAAGLAILRLFMGIAGSTFVMAQHWPTSMYTNETAGAANGIVGGWGNLGGAFTQAMMGSVLFPAFTAAYGGDTVKAWRTVCVFPAIAAFFWGIVVMRISDDAPKGYYSEMKKRGTMDPSFYQYTTTQWYSSSLTSGAHNWNTWILCWQYACCFGVELIMNNAAVLYFTEKFFLTTQQASAIGAIFGSLNIFARGLGGFYSDKSNMKSGMRGRLWLFMVLLVLEGIMIIVFSFTRTLSGAVAAMVVFSFFTQAAEGGIYGVVPYVNARHTGTVSGIVGAGGNIGGVIFGLIFRSLDFDVGFLVVGAVVLASTSLTYFLNIPGHAGLVHGKDSRQAIETRRRHMRIANAEAAAFDRTMRGHSGDRDDMGKEEGDVCSSSEGGGGGAADRKSPTYTAPGDQVEEMGGDGDSDGGESRADAEGVYCSKGDDEVKEKDFGDEEKGCIESDKRCEDD